MPRPYILAVDPGLASGYAFVKRNDPDPPVLVDSGEGDWIDTARWVDSKLREYGGGNVDVVVENFLITIRTAKNTQAPWSLKGIGQMELLALMHGAGEIVLQKPSDSMSFCSNAQLKALSLWHRGGAGHAKEALRHVVLRLARTGYVDRRMVQLET